MINTGYSQNVKKKELQKEYNNILREIKQIQNNIDKTSRERNIGVNEIAMINSKIEKRQKLIDNIESQAKVIESELQLRVKDVSNLGLEIAKLKEEYTKLILWLNKNHSSVNKLAFVMEANNFKETYHRIQYIKKYGDYRARQSKYLSNQVDRIMEKINSLNTIKNEKINILDINKTQQKELTSEKNNRDQVVKKLDKELNELRRKIVAKNEQAEAINRKIKKIIEDEVRKEQERRIAARAREAKKDAATGVTTKREPEDYSQTPEGRLSNSFRESRGNLPWPVSSGEITNKFGRQPHPLAPDLFIDNSGLDIRTPSNSAVKSIYKGEVVRVFDMPTYQNCVMVKHGDYFTVYAYLKSVAVREGMEINAGQILGICGYDDTHGYSLVNIQIWHYQNKQNPQTWLSGR
ncbi:MAG: murein hydrolase activator EnvC family protein [Chitinophagales bacterium]|nr:peptidoglycan DD-metalloendopeptidase family protein [Sphingobacteriales bacterium]